MGSSDLPALNELTLTNSQLEVMRAHVQMCAPLEGCGLLAGSNNKVTRVFLITNKAQSPVKFRMDPVEQLHAFDRIETDSLDLLAIFHSHPAGPETLSATDIAEAGYPVVQIIWSRSNSTVNGPGGQWQARGYKIDNGQSSIVKLQITNDE
jgi:proteasome lid subunit RPN8/RPN11